MSTILHGFEYNDATTPAPWGPRETVWNRQTVNTMVVGTLTGAMDEDGHKHTQVFSSPDGAVAFDATNEAGYNTLVTLDAPGGSDGQRSTVVMYGSGYTASSIALQTGYADSTHLATMVMDSGLGHGSDDDKATITLQTGDAVMTLAQRNIYESAKYSVTVPGATVYIDSGSGGYMRLRGGDTTMEGANKRLDLNGGANTKINLMGDAGASYDGVNIVAGDASYGQIWMWGSANTSSGIEITLNTDAVEHPTSKISISGGANGGAKDVPIQILTDNNVTLGRASGNTNRGLLAGYFRQIDLRTTTSSMVLYGSDSNTVSAGGTLQLTGVPVKINTTGDAEVTGNMYVSGDIYSVQFVNYSSSSIVSGFTGTPSPLNIFFNKVGKQVDVYWNISGTSNASAFCFTLPPSCKAAAGINFVSVCYAIDAGGDASAAMARILGSDSTVNIFPDIVGNNSFTSSGTKASAGHITYQSV